MPPQGVRGARPGCRSGALPPRGPAWRLGALARGLAQGARPGGSPSGAGAAGDGDLGSGDAGSETRPRNPSPQPAVRGPHAGMVP